jgi:hypothetical protein
VLVLVLWQVEDAKLNSLIVKDKQTLKEGHLETTVRWVDRAAVGKRVLVAEQGIADTKHRNLSVVVVLMAAPLLEPQEGFRWDS